MEVKRVMPVLHSHVVRHKYTHPRDVRWGACANRSCVYTHVVIITSTLQHMLGAYALRTCVYVYNYMLPDMRMRTRLGIDL